MCIKLSQFIFANCNALSTADKFCPLSNAYGQIMPSLFPIPNVAAMFSLEFESEQQFLQNF